MHHVRRYEVSGPITGGANLGHLDRVVSAKFLHCTLIPIVINKQLVGTYRFKISDDLMPVTSQIFIQ